MSGQSNKWAGKASQALDKLSNSKDKKSETKPHDTDSGADGDSPGKAEKVMNKVGQKLDNYLDRKQRH